MTNIEKHKIAASFPANFGQATLAIEISSIEYRIFESGIFATSMDDKWDVFVLDDILYLARSWTGFCIYKVFIHSQNEKVILSHFQVNRDDNQYKSKDILSDTILLKQLLQIFLQREDFYLDPKLELPLIKMTISSIDPDNEYKKSIGSNIVALTKHIYRALTTEEQKKYHVVIGWAELESKIATKNDNEPLISLYLQNRKTNAGVTYYFNNDASELLGKITTKNIMGTI